MSVALYRKYRPQNFQLITGQNHIKTTLQNEIEADKIGHAYLFCGPRGTGKTTMARLLAKAANCLDLKEHGEPCNECDSCKEIMENRSLDVIEIDAASHTGVDNVRENIIHNARFTPTKRKYKIFIIDEVHMLSISAFNALLKILEEPPAHVIFILATTESHKVPVTIISRCQRFDYKKINVNDLMERLKWITTQEGVEVEEEVLRRIAKYSLGCVRDAESLLEQVFSLGEKKITIDLAELILPRSNFQSLFDLLKCIVDKNSKGAIESINQLSEAGVDISQLTGDFIEFFRKCLLYKVKNDLSELAQDVEEKSLTELIDVLKKISVAELVRAIGILMKSKEEFKSSYILQLPLELAFIQLCSASAAEQPPAIIEERKIPISETPAPVKAEMKESAVDSQNIRQPEKEAMMPNDSQSIDEHEPADQTALTLTFAQIRSRWPEVLKRLKSDNYSLCMTLSVGQLSGFAGDTVTVSFPFKLQYDRAAEIVNKRLVDTVLSEIFAHRLRFSPRLDEALQSVKVESSPAAALPNASEQDIKDAMDIFGGSVVE